MLKELEELTTAMIEDIGMEKTAKLLKKHLKGYKIYYSKQKPIEQKLYFSGANLDTWEREEQQ